MSLGPGHADALLAALDTAGRLPLLSAADPAFDTAAAYVLADRLRRRRLDRGERILGHKIGFTNRSIWDRYGVHAPIWGPVWDTTVAHVEGLSATVSLAALAQPRLEPEVMFGFGHAPEAGMTEAELAGCIDWVAHGFEIVQTHFEGWRFHAADTVADFALHGRLFVGERVPMSTFADPARELAALEVQLFGDGRLVDEGRGDIVLGGPLTALRLWVDAMAAQPQAWPIEAGSLVSTGTITDAAPLRPGESWQSRLSDARLPGLTLHTEG